MPSLNPPNRLSGPATNGCLPETDGRQFSGLLQAARLAANSIGDYYPNITDPNQLVAAYGSQDGKLVLAHLSAVMYSYWDNAPTGPSVFELSRDHLLEPFRQVFLDECAEWGKRRLNAPVEKSLLLVADTPEGSIIADHCMNKFYKVLGLKKSPAATLTQSGIELPATVRLTAVPFRGALVYDGIMAGKQPEKVPARDADKLRRNYAEAQRNGKVITGFHVTTSTNSSATNPTPSREVSDLSEDEKKQVDDLKAVRKTDGMLILRRFGYTEAENPNHIVVMMKGPLACGSFMSARLVPSAKEVLRELVNLGDSSGALPKMVAIDDKVTATAVNEVTKHAGIFTALYPVPSIEEQALIGSLPPNIFDALKGFDGTSGFPSSPPPQCPVQ